MSRLEIADCGGSTSKGWTYEAADANAGRVMAGVGMLVAVRDGAWMSADRTERRIITRGVTRVAPDSRLARERPGLFRPVDSETASSSPSWSLGREEERAAPTPRSADEFASDTDRPGGILSGRGMVTPLEPVSIGRRLHYPERSRLAPDHPAVVRHPEFFRPADRSDAATREALRQAQRRSAESDDKPWTLRSCWAIHAPWATRAR